MKKNIFDKKISIIGLGYIGLPTAIMLASSGFKVYGNDVKEEIINKTNSGELHFVEDGLSFELKKATLFLFIFEIKFFLFLTNNFESIL